MKESYGKCPSPQSGSASFHLYFFSPPGYGQRAVNAFNDLEVRLRIPDLWQQTALKSLLSGQDVVVDAPTGAGKTYLVELAAETLRKGQIVLTVPTRALANDKYREWRSKGWRVGIATGDIAHDLSAPLVVATLETQKQRLIHGEGPSLLVIDEYQMLGDHARGVNYELAIAMAPPDSRLLLLSGSVSNAQDVVDWLRRLGRPAILVSSEKRPVPLEEIYLDALSGGPPRSVSGFWPRMIAKALLADLGPILVFSPQRRVAEKLARTLCQQLPQENPLALSPEQARLAGKGLAGLLAQRVAYHHSGLSYEQRAGLVEPLAKAGQLRIVVSTTGLASGVNFSMRSVLITESEYTIDQVQRMIPPDEILQMHGRAGRRGLDDIGYALVAPDRPRLRDGRQLPVKRPGLLDWPSLIGIMQAACERGVEPFAQAVEACRKLFNTDGVAIGVEESLAFPDAPCGLSIDAQRARYATPEQVEMLNSQGLWEPLPPASEAPAGKTVIVKDGEMAPALSDASRIEALGRGSLTAIKTRKGTVYGKRVAFAYQDRADKTVFITAGWLRALWSGLPRRMDEESIRGFDLDQLSKAIGGGIVRKLKRQGNRWIALLDFRETLIPACVDSFGVGLIDPVVRKAYPAECRACSQLAICEASLSPRRSPALCWWQLGLIDGRGVPTRRGRIFSFFQGGEGLAIAAALEEKEYGVDAIVVDIANLRAGFRFDEFTEFSHRLSRACRRAYSDRSYEGYLEHGLPIQYGHGAAEVIAMMLHEPQRARQAFNESLRPGDAQRAKLEWLSLLRHIRSAPDLDWDRWTELKRAAAAVLEVDDRPMSFDGLPPLSASQSGRVSHRLRFPPGWR